MPRFSQVALLLATLLSFICGRAISAPLRPFSDSGQPIVSQISGTTLQVAALFKSGAVPRYSDDATLSVHRDGAKLSGSILHRSRRGANTSTRLWPLTTITPPTAANVFNISFTCDSNLESVTRCQAAQAAFVRATAKLSSVLSVSQPIHLNATFDSFCGRTRPNEACNVTSGTLGYAAPSAMYSFTQNDSLSLGVDWNYMYPSGLAKQYLNETFMPLADNFDVSARFNSDWNWFLDDEIMGRIQAGDYQLEQIVFHEIIHGLGFISSWYTWLGDGDDVLLPGYVVRNASGLCVGLSKPYIFNKFMADNVNNIWFKDHAEVLRAGTESVTPTDNYTLWLERFRRTPAFSRARTLLRVSQSHMGVTFWFRSPAKPNSSATSILWDYAFLYSPDGFAPGSSLSHVDNKMYDATEDWIMRPSGSPGVKLADYRPQARRYGPVGWRILAMLRALGWRTVLDQPGWGDYGRGIGGVVGAA